MKRIIRTRLFWIVAVMLVVSTFFHYFSPQIRYPPLASFPLTRHAIERIIFILPTAGAAFAFGQAGGLITLAIAVLIMLPRIFLVSPHPTDAILETAAVAAIGYLVILRPPTLDHLGLVPTLEGLTNDLRERDGIEAELRVEGDRRRLTPEEELVLLRIAQEALNNVRRHSQASQVVTRVEFGPAKVRMIISDNGRGFAVLERTGDLVAIGKLGLIGMYERARLLGGVLLVQSEPGKGTTVIVDVPVQPGPKDEGGSA